MHARTIIRCRHNKTPLRERRFRSRERREPDHSYSRRDHKRKSSREDKDTRGRGSSTHYSPLRSPSLRSQRSSHYQEDRHSDDRKQDRHPDDRSRHYDDRQAVATEPPLGMKPGEDCTQQQPCTPTHLHKINRDSQAAIHIHTRALQIANGAQPHKIVNKLYHEFETERNVLDIEATHTENTAPPDAAEHCNQATVLDIEATHTENTASPDAGEHRVQATAKKEMETEATLTQNTAFTATYTVPSLRQPASSSRYKSRLNHWRRTLLKGVKLLLALLTLISIGLHSTDAVPTTWQNSLNPQNIPTNVHPPIYDNLMENALLIPSDPAHAHSNPKHSPHPQRKKTKRIPLITSTNLNILSVNIRGLTVTKMAALNTYNNTKIALADKANIIILSETKSSPAKGYNYVARAGWTIYPLHRNPHKKWRPGFASLLILQHHSPRA